MKRIGTRAGTLCLLLLGITPLGHAQSFRAYLSVGGSDTNPCTVAAPCRLLPAALNAIASGGEVWILDSANYNSGTVPITRSATIMALPGVVGSFVAFGGAPALSISGGVNVKLNNVVVANNVTFPGTDGIVISGGSLNVAESQIAPPGNGITATNASVRVHHTVFRDSTNGVVASGSSSVDVWNSRFTNISGAGVWGHANAASAAAKMSVSDCSFADVVYGVIANGENSTATMKASISHSTFNSGTTAISIQNITGTGARGTISGSTFSNQLYGIYNYNNALIEVSGDNVIGSTNTNGISGTVTSIPKI